VELSGQTDTHRQTDRQTDNGARSHHLLRCRGWRGDERTKLL